MPIKMYPLIVFDFETTGKEPESCQPMQIACKALHARSLETIPGSEFCEYCRPKCKIDPVVFDITKIDPKDVEKAPGIDVIWPKFVNHIMKYNTEKSKWTAPIATGHNIKGFDLIIANNMNKLFAEKKNKTILFNNLHHIDTMDLVYPLFENTNEIQSYSLNTLREFFGIPLEGAHKADKDVNDVAMIVARVLKFYRSIGEKYMDKFKNSFKKADKLVSCEV